jgi:hypothetical protein
MMKPNHNRNPRPPWPRHEESQCLRFSPLAWMKLQLLLHAGDTEVGGFGISAHEDLLYVTDFVTVRQYTTSVTVRFDDAAVADHFDQCVDAGLSPSRFARIWIHTHPGDSPEPSFTDEETFSRVFGSCDWAVMFICSRTERTYARLRFFAGPGGEMLLPVEVDWASWPALVAAHGDQMPILLGDWAAEFAANVVPEVQQAFDLAPQPMPGGGAGDHLYHWYEGSHEEPFPGQDREQLMEREIITLYEQQWELEDHKPQRSGWEVPA